MGRTCVLRLQIQRHRSSRRSVAGHSCSSCTAAAALCISKKTSVPNLYCTISGGLDKIKIVGGLFGLPCCFLCVICCAMMYRIVSYRMCEVVCEGERS